MSLAARAVALGIDRLTQAAATDLPTDIQIERTPDGLRLTGAGLRHRWLTDVRLHGLGIAARVLR